MRPLVALFLLLPLSVSAAQISPAEFSQRRAALLDALTGDVAVVVFGERAPAVDYLRFTQRAHFTYLTGIAAPDAALVLVRRGGAIQGTIFIGDRTGASDPFSGDAMGADDAARLTGLAGRPRADLMSALDSLAATGVAMHVAGQLRSSAAPEPGTVTPDQQIIDALRQRHPGLAVAPAGSAIGRLRGRKSAAEFALLRTAIDITVQAQREAMGALEPGMHEFEIQALVEYTFRRNGADGPAFATIIGSGSNTGVLHYHRDDRLMLAGEMVVMDIGASYGGYAADVTRSVPVSGTFTPAQREIYQAVRDAQRAAEQAATAGANYQALSSAATESIRASLQRLGLIDSTGSYECQRRPSGEVARCPAILLFYYHGLGHGIGLDVHDPEQSFGGGLAPGSAFTIEPGIYVRANVLDLVPDRPANAAYRAQLAALLPRYRHIGVRIEDDYFFTDRGLEWVSRAPREIDEIEALMRQPWTGPTRRPDLIGRYRPGTP